MPGKYPLDALRTLRAAREDAAARALAERQRELAERAALVQSSREDLARVAAARRNEREAAAAELSAEGLRAVDLVRGLDRDRAQGLLEAEGVSALDRATRAERAAEVERQHASHALGAAHSEREAVERHHHAFRVEQTRAAEEAEDEASLDRWNAGLRGANQR